MKTTTLGYDGKGQIRLNNKNEIDKHKIDFNNQYILEKIINLKKEISVIITLKNGLSIDLTTGI